MAKVKVLVEGYAKEIDRIEYASSTVVLVEAGKDKIIVDPGMDRKMLLEALKREKISAKDINKVILTHMHPDHVLLAGIFENAEIIYSTENYHFDGMIEENFSEADSEGVEIIHTPGHDPWHYSVIVDTDKGKIVIASDLFWWKDGVEQKTDRESLMNLEDPYMKDEKALKESRKKILGIADFIIPGHGKMFKLGK